MEKVDRLGWVDGIVVAPFGTNIGIRVNDPKSLPIIRRLVGELGWTPNNEQRVDFLLSAKLGAPPKRRGQKNYHLLYVGTSRMIRTLNKDDILTFLTAYLPDLARLTAKGLIFLPGSVVSVGGRVLVLPAQQGTGRSTLLDEMKRRGAEVLTEEFFALGTGGLIHLAHGEELGRPKYPVVCFTEYSRRNKTLRARTLSPGETALHFFSKALASRTNPEGSLKIASEFANEALCLKGRRGEATQAVDYLLKKLQVQ